MGAIIVTVTDEAKRFAVDLEVPDMQKIETLKEDIIGSLNGYKPELYLTPFSMELYSERLKRIINSHETLAQAGVWNGDYIAHVRRK